MNTSVLGSGASARSTITATIGYLSIALAAWMLSMTNAGWFAGVFPRTTSMLMPLSIILIVVGVLAFVSERTLDAVVLLSTAGLFWSDQGYIAAMVAGAGRVTPHYDAWGALIWAVFYFYVWLAAMKASSMRGVFLLAVWLTLLALAIADWSGAHALTVIGGYLGLIAAILALLISASAILGRETPGAATG